MLTRLDDFPIHQAPRPIAAPATTDRNAYGRYWFGLAHLRGEVAVEAAFGRYPNLGVTDAHLSIVRDGHQHSFHASRRAPGDPLDLTVGPFRLEIVEPMHELRITVEENDTGITGELSWRARTGALLEDHTVMTDGPHVIVDMERFTQFGTWAGHVGVDGEATAFGHDETVGIRDRSWGVRPVGQQPVGRPSASKPSAWLWAPIHFDDACTLSGYFQHPGGNIWWSGGHRVPVVDPVPDVTDHDLPGLGTLRPVGQRLEFHPGTRWVRRAEIDLVDELGEVHALELEPMVRFDMRGIGYTNPDWGHGQWRGELAIGRESWAMADVAADDPTHQHVHHTVRARLDGRDGVGIFEQIIFGPHTQFGFHDLLDGWSG